MHIKKHRTRRCIVIEDPTNEFFPIGRGPTANARALLMQLHASAVATFPLKRTNYQSSAFIDRCAREIGITRTPSSAMTGSNR